eukprot:GHVL01043725.1.p1 GENE.GHVL01043725.1~~GHVL01043725.1.p1  ORF type:complete len:193 (+),score=25.81 GHVL01043725.1:1371-1949(+)
MPDIPPVMTCISQDGLTNRSHDKMCRESIKDSPTGFLTYEEKKQMYESPQQPHQNRPLLIFQSQQNREFKPIFAEKDTPIVYKKLRIDYRSMLINYRNYIFDERRLPIDEQKSIFEQRKLPIDEQKSIFDIKKKALLIRRGEIEFLVKQLKHQFDFSGRMEELSIIISKRKKIQLLIQDFNDDLKEFKNLIN